MELLRISKPDRILTGTIALEGSKSISNRALIVLALAGADPAEWLENLSVSKDTTTLYRLLTQKGSSFDAGDAGTTFRFMTAFLALRNGVQVLTGSSRMRERPIGGLVEGLRSIGANIEYLEKAGYPPLRIGEMHPRGGPARVRINAGTSSQFLSALLMIGPYLPDGLELVPEGPLVSRPYLEMTVQLMRHFGAGVVWSDGSVAVSPGAYRARPFVVESDWSAASYWYALAALADEADINLQGLFAESWQGDSVLINMMRAFGVRTTAMPPDLVSGAPAALRLEKSEPVVEKHFEWDFTDCPDIAQTLAVVCAGLGAKGTFSGLETLYVKETDRVAAIQAELAKTGVTFTELSGSPGKFELNGRANWNAPPRFATYSDHRMAMSFAALGMLKPVDIEHPAVVAKSYPTFWGHLTQAGFHCERREEHS
ncbi:MAG: 3-phosphoshikimate 1-carboxyvinyltransferase [Lewinellaceae bacterium]|nr:3-phosphoshikimate 1-carboxyvinyltransferase [Lewinellaceae bacterium]